MVQHAPWRPPVFNNLHSPADCKREPSADGIQTALSAPILSPFPFSSLVLSANFQAGEGGSLLLEVQVQAADQWSEFYKLGLLSPHIKTSFPAQQTAFGHLETDELVLAKPASGYRFRINLPAQPNGTGLPLAGYALRLNMMKRPLPACRPARLKKRFVLFPKWNLNTRTAAACAAPYPYV